MTVAELPFALIARAIGRSLVADPHFASMSDACMKNMCAQLADKSTSANLTATIIAMFTMFAMYDLSLLETVYQRVVQPSAPPPPLPLREVLDDEGLLDADGRLLTNHPDIRMVAEDVEMPLAPDGRCPDGWLDGKGGLVVVSPEPKRRM